MTTPLACPAAHAIPTEVLQRFDRPGPRYTSYPTADRFVEAQGARLVTGLEGLTVNAVLDAATIAFSGSRWDSS